MSDAELALRALALLDLTNLDERCTEPAIDALCEKAVAPPGPVAAICVWPQFVRRARERLRGAPMRIATVVNFPRGDADVERVAEDTSEALADGADEIDLVMPYRAFLAGDAAAAAQMIAAVRERVTNGRRLKVILETGALGDRETIAAASRLAIAEGADFIKTSTGKIPVSATPDAVATMLDVIRETGKRVGCKPSGGIRTLADARVYLELADRILGDGWASPSTFRIGASGLYDALVEAAGGAVAPDERGTP